MQILKWRSFQPQRNTSQIDYLEKGGSILCSKKSF
jgi:hypothetical protein